MGTEEKKVTHVDWDGAALAGAGSARLAGWQPGSPGITGVLIWFYLVESTDSVGNETRVQC